MGGKGLGTTLLSIGALLSNNTEATENIDGGGLRRKRSFDSNYHSRHHASYHRRLSDNESVSPLDQELAQRFFLPTKNQENEELDVRELILQMNLDLSLSLATPSPSQYPTQRPTARPTATTASPSVSTAPTATSCDNPGTCENRLRDQIYAVSVRVGTTAELEDPNSAQSLASEWILEECDAQPPIDPCDERQIILNEQRYALAVMYFSLGGDNWNNGAQTSGEGAWLSAENYCEWGVEVSTTGGSYNQLVCDEFGNVLNLNLRKFAVSCSPFIHVAFLCVFNDHACIHSLLK